MDIFYVINMDKNGKFLTTYPPPLVHVVIECPLIVIIRVRTPYWRFPPVRLFPPVLLFRTLEYNLIQSEDAWLERKNECYEKLVKKFSLSLLTTED